jgi:hypothetical protein
MRCGKKSQHLLIVHRRSVRHRSIHSTRFHGAPRFSWRAIIRPQRPS